MYPAGFSCPNRFSDLTLSIMINHDQNQLKPSHPQTKLNIVQAQYMYTIRALYCFKHKVAMSP